MKPEPGSSPVSFLAHVARLPKNGLPVMIEATEKQRAALATVHGLEKVERFVADLVVSGWKRGGVHVSGTVRATIVQSCIVTLEPIEAYIDEAVEGIFLPESSKLKRPDYVPGGEIILDAEGPDSPETFSGDSIDVGGLAEQFFGLAIDPYPRKAGVAVGSPDESEEENHGPLYEKLKLLRGKP